MKRVMSLSQILKQGLFLLLCVCVLFPAVHLQAAGFTVNTAKDTVDANPGDGAAADSGGKCSLRAAIMEANALSGADTITIPAGTYKLTVSGADEDNCISGDLDIRSDLTINGAGKNLTTIDGDELDRVFHIRGEWTVTIANLTVRNGRSPNGVSVTSSSILEAREISSETKLNKSFDQTFSKVWLPAGPPEARKKNISGTAAVTAGNGGYGGGILNRYGKLTINNCKIVNNTTGNGGSYSGSGNGESGDGGYGGGLCNLAGTVVINHSSISDNTTGNGGRDCDEWGGRGGHGGGLFNLDGNLTLNNCTVKDNLCGKPGRGWDGYGAGGYGGGIANRQTNGNTGTLTLTGCTVMDNKTGDANGHEGSAGYGGGIQNTGTTFINNCLIYRNRCGEAFSGGSGGGIANSGALYATNSTISANSYNSYEDPSDAYGGGLFNYGDSGFALLESCTVTGNNDGGLCNGEPAYWIYGPTPTSTLKIHNTIVANNLIYNWATSSYVANDCVGRIKSRGYNLIEGLSAIYFVDIEGETDGNIIGADPKLGALVDNGGPTKTHALLKGSPCLDAGDPDDYETTDQRGVLRPKDGDGDGTPLPDIGAYEEFTPQIDITTPSAGAKVSCTVLLEAEANTRYVDFKIDGVLLQTVDGAPHTCSWDTSVHANGSHTIKAVGSDTPGGFSARDTVNVKVDNMIINLTVSPYEESAWLIAKYYGHVTFTIPHTGQTAPTAYQIERKEAGGTTFTIVKEVTGAEMGGASYTYYDPLPNNNTNYTYRITAVDGAGVIVGRSDEQTI